ncbi:MAG: Rpn family recombination-promoting nuclease/putative transposase [Gammaproteobacteria bacterium]
MAKQHLVRFDWAMKKLLRSKANFGILEGFLSELLKQDLKILELLESESNKDHRDDKQNRVDMLVRLQSGEIVLIEVQVNTEDDYLHRILYGTSKIIVEHLGEGEKYKAIKKVYSVNILYFDLGQGQDYIYHGTTRFIGVHNNDELSLNDEQKKVYGKDATFKIYPEYYLIKVNQFNDIAKNTLDEWIYFLKNEEVKDTFRAKGLAEAKSKFNEMKFTPAEREEYQNYVKIRRIQASEIESSYNQGMYEGEKLGIEKGIKEGKELGKQEGLKEGITQAARSMAQKLLTEGMSLERIAQLTELPVKDITALQKEKLIDL